MSSSILRAFVFSFYHVLTKIKKLSAAMVNIYTGSNNVEHFKSCLTKRRINTMFWTNSKHCYCLESKVWQTLSTFEELYS